MFGGVSPIFLPKQYTESKLWFDASNPSNNNTRPANGAAMSAWTDCISANNASQGTGANQPTYNISGDLTGLLFDGGNDSMGITSAADLCMQTGLVIIGVLKADAGATNDIWFSKGTGGTNNEWFFFMDTNGKINFGSHNTLNASQASGISTTDIRNANHIVMGKFDGTNISIWINGAQENSAAISGTLKTNVGDLTLGAQATGNNYAGIIRDVIVLNNPSTGLIKLLNSYLSQKYGIAVVI